MMLVTPLCYFCLLLTAVATTAFQSNKHGKGYFWWTPARRHPVATSSPVVTSSSFANVDDNRVRWQQRTARCASAAGSGDAPVLSVESSSLTASILLSTVEDFEAWFESCSGSYCHPSVRHTTFGSLRGLEWRRDGGDLAASSRAGQLVAKVPKNSVLQSDFTDKDWDANLACDLWKETRLGRASKIWGYVDLLAPGEECSVTSSRANGEPPASTAPNALRHWTDEQRNRLESTADGRRLLDELDKQNRSWREKYDTVVRSKRGGGDDDDYQAAMSWSQFRWAMEVVHSRAFCGVGGSAAGSTVGGLFSPATLLSLLVPVAAAAAGWFYNLSTSEPSDLVLAALAFLAAMPVALNAIKSGQGEEPSCAVLLPLIDSANHLQSADSTIEYDPMSDAFQLTIGPGCIVTESGDGEGEEQQRQQLFISYGPKSDPELLLNYGFLPGVPCNDGDSPASRERQRSELANAFLARSS